MVNLLEIIMEIKLQVPVASGLSSKAVQPLPSTVPKKEDVLDTAVPASHTELNENARTEFTTLFDAVMDVCSVCDTDFGSGLILMRWKRKIVCSGT